MASFPVGRLDSVNKWLVTFDKVFDRTPVACLTNAIVLIARGALSLLASPETIRNNRYFTHIKDKSLIRIVFLTVVLVVGFIPVAIYDLGKHFEKNRVKEAQRNFVEGSKQYDAGNVEAAFKLFEKAAKGKCAAAMYNVALAYERGEGVAQNDNEANKWYEKAGLAGYKAGFEALANRHLRGEGGRKDVGRALLFAKEHAKLDAEAAWNLGLKLVRGEDFALNKKDGEFWLLDAAKRDPVKELEYGLKLLKGEDVDKNEKAGKERIEAAVKASANAQFSYGIELLRGSNVAKDESTGLKNLQEAVARDPNLGYKLGQVFQGAAPYAGLVAQNMESAIKAYEAAAINGHRDALFHLGYTYHAARGVPVNFARARECYEGAANKGHAGALYNLGVMHMEGKIFGEPASNEKALECFKKAANLGQRDAPARVAELQLKVKAAPAPAAGSGGAVAGAMAVPAVA